jgi:hypothetical protein
VTAHMEAFALLPLAAWLLTWRTATALVTTGALLTVLGRRIQKRRQP